MFRFKSTNFLLVLILAVTGQSAGAATGPVQIFMAGDSTMATKPKTKHPATGWGTEFAKHFTGNVQVHNRALPGRSARSFIEEGLWQGIRQNLQPGDFVVIQFGHNDENPRRTEQYTTAEEFRRYLSRYLTETREKGATPILMTPISRRQFTRNGQLKRTHHYDAVMRELARSEKVALVDLEELTWKYLQYLGEEDSRPLYLNLPPGKYPAYPNGNRDNIHLSERGARVVAKLAIDELVKREHRLAGLKSPLKTGPDKLQE